MNVGRGKQEIASKSSYSRIVGYRTKKIYEGIPIREFTVGQFWYIFVSQEMAQQLKQKDQAIETLKVWITNSFCLWFTNLVIDGSDQKTKSNWNIKTKTNIRYAGCWIAFAIINAISLEHNEAENTKLEWQLEKRRLETNHASQVQTLQDQLKDAKKR